MATLIKDDNGQPVPQYKNSSSGNYEAATGSGGAVDANIKNMPATMTHTDGTLKVTLAGASANVPAENRVRYVLTTALSAVVVAQSAGGNGTQQGFNLGTDGTESEVYILINTDQQPWGLTLSNYPFGSGYGNSFYPNFWQKATAYPTSVAPAIALILGAPWAQTGAENPANLSAAKDYIIPIMSGAGATFYNQCTTAAATVTIKVLRVWR